jgi:hypothetical protein
VSFWITDKALEWVEAAESEAGQPADAVWASQLVSADLMRWSRWWIGLGAFVVAFFAAGTAGMLGMAIVVESPSYLIALAGLLAVAVAALAVCAVVLWRLHRSGRRLARALRWWLALRAGVIPDQGIAGWIAPRAVLFKPVVFVRILTGTLAGLIGIFGLTAIGYSVTEEAVLVLASASWGLLGTACCLGQFGAVMRLVSGLADADPLWSTVR